MEHPLMSLSLIFPPSLQVIFLLLLDLLLSNSASAIIHNNQTDMFSLLQFKDQINDDPKGILASWNDSIPICQWVGVTCGHRHKRVIRLNLLAQELSGNIPPHIGNLSFLHSLILANNSFYGRIPPEVGRLTRLQSLYLMNNSLRGEIPVNLSHCSNLRYVVLDNNRLQGPIPFELGSLSELVGLSLLGNNLTGKFPASIGNLSALQILSFAYNHLEGEIPDAVSQMRSLTDFQVGINNFSGPFPPPLYNLSSLNILVLSNNNFYGKVRADTGILLPNLQFFVLGRNRFTGPIPLSMSNASKLQMIDFDSNNFTGNIPINLGNLQNIYFLSLGYNTLGTGGDDLNILTSLTNCSQLQILDIGVNQLRGALPNSIANLSIQLTWLNIGSNIIGGSIPSEIQNLVNLNALGMDHNFLAGSIPTSLGKLSKLKMVDLNTNNLTGEIPSTIGNMTQLLFLILNTNRLEGSIPSSLKNCKNLLALDLSQNKLNGTIPEYLMNLPSLSVGLNMSHNSFTGPLSAEVGNMKYLVVLDVSYNKLSGEVPVTIGSCLALEQLYMQENIFYGIVPSMSQLKGLKYLDLSSNNFSGQIPQYMVNLSFLQNLNLSFNNLEGEVPIGGVFSNASAVEVYGNIKLCGGIPDLHLHQCPMQKPDKSGKHTTLKLVLVIVIPILFTGLTLSLLSRYWTRKLNRKPLSTSSFGHFYPKISYKELLEATGGFSSDNLIGSGNFGSVYKGILNLDETIVAVKVFNLHQRGAAKSFMAECKVLRNVKHRNLVKILTACSSTDFDGNEFKALVYEFIPNGSLESWLHSQDGQMELRKLNFLQRINIAIDLASALHYLHNQCQTPIVHCDLKPSNILLDNDLTAHVSDFGLARILSISSEDIVSGQFSSFGVKGTIGYAAPEYGMGEQLSTHGDLYSFGILLLEMFTGKRPTDELFKDDLNLHNFAKMALSERVMEIVDQFLHSEVIQGAQSSVASSSNHGTEGIECFISVLKIGVACSTEYPRDRMGLNDISLELLSIRDKFLKTRRHNQGQQIGRPLKFVT